MDAVEKAILEEIAKIAASAPTVPGDCDEQVLVDERAFQRRFGFDAPRERREQVVQLKHDADLTDREIRGLNRTRSLTFKNGMASISAPLIVALWGGFCIAYLFGLMLLAFYAAERSTQDPIVVVAKLAVVEAVLLATCVLVSHVYVWPRQLLKRVRSRATH